MQNLRTRQGNREKINVINIQQASHTEAGRAIEAHRKQQTNLSVELL